MRACNKNIYTVLEYTRKLLFLADKGDIQREDEGCGVLYGIVRDCAYKIRDRAEQERDNHIRRGVWDQEEVPATSMPSPDD